MGVVNVTPDSFSDGGSYLATDHAAKHAADLADAGADLLDVGGESTRPGANPVSESDELDRVIPVIRAIRGRGISIPITIDTTKARVAREAIAAGADAVNDVSAMEADPDMGPTVAALGVPIILMHMAGNPRTMQADPHYDNVTREVADHLEGRIRVAVAHGIPRAAVAVDPGIGFGKTVRHNLVLLKGLPHLMGLGVPVLVGTSRKSFIGRLLDDAPVTGREFGTAATVAWAAAHGARVVRVHAVAPMAQVTAIIDAIRDA